MVSGSFGVDPEMDSVSFTADEADGHGLSMGSGAPGRCSAPLETALSTGGMPFFISSTCSGVGVWTGIPSRLRVAM